MAPTAPIRVPASKRVNFLDKLPAELRNEIYELAFTTDAYQQNESIDLLAAQPPDNSLLLACRQIRNEARQLYKAADQKFWSDQPFILALDCNVRNKILSLNASSLQHIVNFTLKLPDGETWTMIDNRGGWVRHGIEGDSYMRFVEKIISISSAQTGWTGFETRAELEAECARAGPGLSLWRQLLYFAGVYS